ncbi:transposase [Streptomyces sp. NPDC101225]|uniref:transposase n=1 Tax=Streptomyces sp. NPDC101225 TaxID=3366135 RepID=UPI0037F2524D
MENLVGIAGTGPADVQVVIGGTGGDMAQFASAGHLASRIGADPGTNESAGGTKSKRTRTGDADHAWWASPRWPCPGSRTATSPPAAAGHRI